MTEPELLVNQIVYSRCYEAQGEVFKFADIDLGMPREASIHFESEDGSQYTETVPTDWSIRELRGFVEAIF